jgi:hypothetical protein
MNEQTMRALPADPRFRMQAAGALAVAVVAAAGIAWWFADWLQATRLLHPTTAQQRLLEAFRWAAGAGAASILVLAAVLWHTATRTLQAGEYPPPGTRVLLATPVLEGDTALHRARVLRMLAALCVLVAVALLLLAWRVAPMFSLTPTA